VGIASIKKRGRKFAVGYSSRTITVPPPSNPQTISVNPSTNIVYATTGNGIAAMDGNTNTVTATIPVGTVNYSPSDLSVNPSTNMVYVGYWRPVPGGNGVQSGTQRSIVFSISENYTTDFCNNRTGE